jgi:GST-like protein
MDNQSSYTPPAVWTWNKDSGGKFASINRPIAAVTHNKVQLTGSE